MNEEERMTIKKKQELSLRYEELNQILREKKKIDDRIADIMLEANRLQRESSQLDHKFHSLAIKVAPTEICEVKTTKPKISTEDAELVRQLKVLVESKGPDILADLAKRLKKES